MHKALVALFVLTLSTGAFAVSGGEGDNTGCNGAGNANSPCAGQGGNGGAGGNGGDGGSSSSTATNTVTNSNRNDNTNVNANSNRQHQEQYQSQGQNQSQQSRSHANATGGSVGNTSATGGAVGDTSASVSGSGNGGVSNVSVQQNDTTKEAAKTAYVQPVTVLQSDSCNVGVSAGGQGFAFGFSVSGTTRDENCERIKLAREVSGYDKAAGLQILKGDPRVQEAFDKLYGAKKANVYDGVTLAQETRLERGQ